MSNPIKLLSESLLLKYAGLILLLGACGAPNLFGMPVNGAPNLFGMPVNGAPNLFGMHNKFSGPGAPAHPTPTPVKKPAKTAPAPKTELPKVIVSVTAARVRSAATTGSAEIRRLKLGTVLPVLDKTTGPAFWYKVQLPAGSRVATGWMSSTVTGSFDAAKAENIYRQLTSRNFKKEGMSFSDSVEVYEFLTRVLPEVKTNDVAAELGLKRLQSLAAALDAVGVMNSEKQPYKNFTTAQDKNIVYSDPAGQWFVRADLFWDLHKKYSGTSSGEEIAWAAARTSLPGECEGYINCYLYLIRETDGEYLNLYPEGKHAPEALKNITDYLAPIVADLKEKKNYDGPSDTSDRAEYNRHLAGLRAIISRLPLVEKDKPLRQIGLLAEAYR